jgi:hypothetical protein
MNDFDLGDSRQVKAEPHRAKPGPSTVRLGYLFEKAGRNPLHSSTRAAHPSLGLSLGCSIPIMELPIKLLSFVLLLVSSPFVTALKFDIQAHSGHESVSRERCIRNFVAKDQLVVVTATVSGSRGDGQVLNMHVRCSSRRAYEDGKFSRALTAQMDTDQRRSRQRLPQTEGRGGRESLCLHLALGCSLRCLLRESALKS